VNACRATNFQSKGGGITMNTLNRIVVKKRKPSTTENESGYRVMNSLVTCAVSNVISETVTNNNSLEVYASKCFLVMLS
jgi:hypothetical protein